MKTVPLTEQLEKLKADLLADHEAGAPLDGLLRRAGKMVIEELLQGEVADALGREPYQRRDPQTPQGYRNGYKTRQVKTAEGALAVEVPQVRGLEDYASVLWPLVKNASPALEKLVVEMYARGLSTRDIEDLLKTLAPQQPADRPLLSRSSVSEITDALLAEHQAFIARDLSGYEVVYLFADAVFESLQAQGGCRQAILVSWGIQADGSKVLLHLSVGRKESTDAWTEHFRSLVKRGLKSPLTVTTDGAPGLIKAVEGMWPESSRIRCWFHKMKSVLEKVPESMAGPIKALLADVRDAPDHATGEKRARALMAEYQKALPGAMACLGEDLDASLEHLKLPLAHRKCVRMTRNGQTLVLQASRDKNVAAMHELMTIRHFLERSAGHVAEAPQDASHILVVLDHREARIYKADMHGTVPQRIVPLDPHGFGRNLHYVQDDSNGQRKPERKSFYEAIARTLEGATNILIFGSGTAASSAMAHLVAELKRHHHELAGRLVGAVVLDQRHLSEDQLLATARKLYAERDQAARSQG